MQLSPSSPLLVSLLNSRSPTLRFCAARAVSSRLLWATVRSTQDLSVPVVAMERRSRTRQLWILVGSILALAQHLEVRTWIVHGTPSGVDAVPAVA